MEPFVNQYKTGSLLPTLVSNYSEGFYGSRLIAALEESVKVYQVLWEKSDCWCLVFSEDP